MDDPALLRYSRQILLPEIDLQGQQRLMSATVMVVGLGGLGSAAASYLAAAGIGHLILVDFDRVELANLQRQVLYRDCDQGRLKVEAARARLTEINPLCRVTARAERYIDAELPDTVDVLLDASDNFAARQALNVASVKRGLPLVSGAAIRFEAQVSVFNPADPEGPCYACLYGSDEDTTESCVETGIIAPLAGIVGSIQALETIKLITGAGTPLTGRLLRLDALTMQWASATVRRDPRCPVCGSQAP
ncbi:MAG: HesA/MoeB/ThiF family protein [Gammaproteobacteria bacterium]